MARRPLTDILLCGVSLGALGTCLRPYAPRNVVGASDANIEASGFFGRIKLWFKLIFGGVLGGGVVVREVVRRRDAPAPNRHKTRLRQRKLPLARRPDALAHHFLYRYGYTRFRHWIYNRTLIPRIAWCFRDWNWRWAKRQSFAGCVGEAQLSAMCDAPLRPD
mgnify:CR=1 FL=1